MMRKQTRKLIEAKARIKELEEVLCPCEQHDWIRTETVPWFNGGMVDNKYRYVCRRCKKRMETWNPAMEKAAP